MKRLGQKLTALFLSLAMMITLFPATTARAIGKNPLEKLKDLLIQIEGNAYELDAFKWDPDMIHTFLIDLVKEGVKPDDEGSVIMAVMELLAGKHLKAADEAGKTEKLKKFLMDRTPLAQKHWDKFKKTADTLSVRHISD